MEITAVTPNLKLGLLAAARTSEPLGGWDRAGALAVERVETDCDNFRPDSVSRLMRRRSPRRSAAD